jgi:predicted dehydrogenase
MSGVTRRQFGATAGKTAAAALLASAASTRRVLGANDRVRIGVIGLGNRGDQVLDAFLAHKDVEVTALCDIHAPYVAFAKTKSGGSPAELGDYRRLIERPDVDAVVINTPDHWHALQMIEACAAGKDVYVEKPLSLVVAEGRAMVDAAKRHNRVVQVGIHRRSAAFVKEAADLVRGGAIGKVTVVRAFHVQNEWPKGIGAPADAEPPAGFDWDAWLGPAPRRAYNKNRTFYRFRWFYDYSGGQVTNFGVHYLDAIHWALGHDAPLAVTAMGGKFANFDNREVPDTLEVLWRYPGDTLVTFSQYNANAAPASRERRIEIEFRGTKGTLSLFGDGFEIVPDEITPNEFPARTPLDRQYERGYRVGAKAEIQPMKRTGGDANTVHHTRNFLDCVKSRAACHCDIETGHRSTSATLLGNVAIRSRAYLEWDREAERFTNHTDANKLLTYKYRAPYKAPWT